VGYVVLALAAYAAVRAKAARRWIAIAAVGSCLALGARLQIGSWTSPLPLPFAWLSRALPVVGWDVPARFAWLVVLGTAIAASAGLAALARAGRRGPAVAALLAVLALVETWPRVPRSPLPAPRFLRDLAKDGERWAVLDLTGDSRQLWNQVLHRHPLAGATAGPPVLAAAVPQGGDGGARATGTGIPSIRALQEARVRFVIAERGASLGPVSRLPRVHAGDGLVVLEVPPVGIAAGVLPGAAVAGAGRRLGD
jgi:hypothetical protein